ncbi:MAG: SpoIIE family protein phosphatase [Bacteroidota bacterium]
MPKHILVVDDEPDFELLVTQKFRRQIRSKEYAFRFAGDGVEALEMLRRDPEIDLVVTDLNMPRMDGLRLLSEVGQLDRLLKVLVVSAYGDIGNIRSAMNRGAFDFITKPVDFKDLQATITKTYGELDALKQGAHSRRQLAVLRRELEIASQIQASVLPSTFPAFPERADFDLYATSLPAREVGGDFYDFFLIDEHRLGFSIGDVSGKGIGAALFMAVARTLLRATALQGGDPASCVRHVNRVLFPETPRRLFVTLIYGILDLRTGVITYCHAGHTLPYVLRHDGSVELLPRTKSLAVCLVQDFAYTNQHVSLAPNDSLFLYSDGVPEAARADGHQFGDEHLQTTLQRLGPALPMDLVRHVLRHVDAFAEGAEPSDDLTMLHLQYRGQEAPLEPAAALQPSATA